MTNAVSRFRPVYRELTDDEKFLRDAIKQHAVLLEQLYGEVIRTKGSSRYHALAMTSLEESVMWIVKELTA